MKLTQIDKISYKNRIGKNLEVKLMIINHNISVLTAYRHLMNNQNMMYKSLERLSSGLRINSAADDAAGLAISEKMRVQIRGLGMAQKNSLDAISLLQTAEGALHETHAMLQRAREIAVQAANDTNTEDERQALQAELNQLLEEIDAITGRTEFNTQKLVDGSFTDKVFQIGANAGQNLKVSIGAMDTAGLGITDLKVDTNDSSGGLLTHEDASRAIGMFDEAIKKVSSERGKIGATQNRLEHTINNLATTQENLTAAESRIRDVDMAKEIMAFTKQSILSQVAMAMLAQAMQTQQGILQLLK